MSPIKPIPEIPEPPRIPRNYGLGRLAENSLVRFVVQLFNRGKDALAELVRNAIERFVESFEAEGIKLVAPVLDRVIADPNLPPDVKGLLVAARSGQHQAGIIVIVGALFAVATQLFPAALSGLSAKIQQGSYNLFNPNLLDFSTWHAAHLRNPGVRPQMLQELAWQGWTLAQVNTAELASEVRLGASEILMALHRGDLTTTQATVRLKELGIALPDINIWLKLAQQIPGAIDLTRFALREVWRDDIASKYGYDQGRVPQFAEWMAKQGYAPEWAQAFWRAHWVVPSIGQGFEMMHRKIIDPDELVELLKVNDVAPGWIPHLVEMARPVPGRIDRRWAFEEGAINETQLYELYKSDGYDDFWAGVLTDTVVKRSVSEAKGLTRAAVVSAYKKRRLSSAEAVVLLEDVGIPVGVANFYLGQADSDHADDLLDRRIDVVGRQFSVGDLTANEASDALRALAVGSAEIAVYLEEWSIARTSKVRRPSRANLDKFFKDGVIDVARYRDQMDRLGYSALYIDWYLGALAIERQELAEKEERVVHREAERIVKDRRKTDYQLAKSRIDVNIAELNAAVASAQVALVEAQNERDARLTHALPAAEIAELEREYQPLLFDAEAAIAEARLQITRLQTNIKDQREAIALVDRSLVENVDMTFFAALKAERLTAQTEQARLGELIATNRVLIAQLKEAILTFTNVAEVDNAKATILALQTEIAQFSEQQAFHLTRIREIDEAMAEALSPVRRSELRSEKSALQVGIAGIEREIAMLREEVRSVQGDRETLERELDVRVTALPGSEIQIAIRSQFLTRIAEIQANIKTYRENVAQLRLEKSRLAVEWRS